MARDRSVEVIRVQIEAATVLQDLAHKSSGVPVVFEQSVLYPYIRFKAQCSVPTIGGRKTISIDCLVDGVNGHGMTADAFSTDAMFDPDETKLQPVTRGDEARRTAQRTVTHGLGKKLKMIAPFDVRLDEIGTVYKRFWIVRIGDGRLMVDSVTGAMHSVCASAA